MGRKQRDRDPSVYHHVYARTVEQRLTMIDYKKVAPLIGGILARYQFIYDIKIHSYNFLGNHFHLLLSAPNQNLDEFMENVMREISKRINKLYNVTGHFWADRHKDEVIEDDEGAFRCMIYILTNAVGHELVESSTEWTGLNSLKQTISSAPRLFDFYLRENRRRAKRIEYKLVITQLPQFENLSVDERREKLGLLIADKEAILKKNRKFPSKNIRRRKYTFGELPPLRLAAQKKRFFSQSMKAKERRAALRARAHQYNAASRRYRLGEKNIVFPLYTYAPPLHRRPRIKAFVWALAA